MACIMIFYIYIYIYIYIYTYTHIYIYTYIHITYLSTIATPSLVDAEKVDTKINCASVSRNAKPATNWMDSQAWRWNVRWKRYRLWKRKSYGDDHGKYRNILFHILYYIYIYMLYIYYIYIYILYIYIYIIYILYIYIDWPIGYTWYAGMSHWLQSWPVWSSHIESSLFTRCQDLCPMFAEVAVDGDAPRETKTMVSRLGIEPLGLSDYLPLRYYRGLNIFKPCGCVWK